MLTVFIIPPSEIKRVVSTTSDFQRTGADIPQVSDNQQQNFALYEQLTAENELAIRSEAGRQTVCARSWEGGLCPKLPARGASDNIRMTKIGQGLL
jgi:hypothetical protein